MINHTEEIPSVFQDQVCSFVDIWHFELMFSHVYHAQTELFLALPPDFVMVAVWYDWMRLTIMWWMNGKLFKFCICNMNASIQFIIYLSVDEIQRILVKSMGPSCTSVKCYEVPDKTSPDRWFETEEKSCLLTWQVICMKEEVMMHFTFLWNRMPVLKRHFCGALWLVACSS